MFQFLAALILAVCYGQQMPEGRVRMNATIIDSPVEQIIWCGASVVINQDEVVQQEENTQVSRKVAYALSTHGVLYKSVDYGLRWENVSEQLVKKNNLDESYRISEVLQSPADSRVLFIIGTNGTSFRTEDCGRFFLPFKHERKLFGFKLNKMDAKIIMALNEKACQRSTDSLCRDKYKKELYISVDFGMSWSMVLSHVRDATWDKLLHYAIVPDSRIIVSHIADNGSLLVSYSDDYYKSHSVIRWFAFGFFQTPTYLFLLVRADALSEGYDLEIAPAYAETYRPMEIVLPLDDNSKHTFTVLDTQLGQIYLSVTHDEDLPRLTNIYMSDNQGNDYSLSLMNNVRSVDSGNCDFERVGGIDGVYIANVYDSNEVSKLRQRRQSVTIEKDQKKKQFDRLDSYRRSVISFDRGGDWHGLKAPKYDYNGQPLSCSGDCQLHLKGRTESNHNPIYSSENAVGIIIGTGNTGLYLTQKDEEVNTYLSRDGGHNWFEILKGSYIYEIGDHGGLVLFAQDDRPTNSLLYSWDEGLTHDKLKFQYTIEIDNIVTEPTNMEQKFILYGRSDKKTLAIDDSQPNTLRGVILSLDFTTLHQRVCTGQWDPSMPESDYEYWTPINYLGDKCLLGRKVKYLRRKRNAKCFNPDDKEKNIVEENCTCTALDWECDYGYARKIEGGPCAPQTNSFNQQTIIKPPNNCKGTYMKTQGYRKIPGNSCQGGSSFLVSIQVQQKNHALGKRPM